MRSKEWKEKYEQRNGDLTAFPIGLLIADLQSAEEALTDSLESGWPSVLPIRVKKTDKIPDPEAWRCTCKGFHNDPICPYHHPEEWKKESTDTYTANSFIPKTPVPFERINVGCRGAEISSLILADKINSLVDAVNDLIAGRMPKP